MTPEEKGIPFPVQRAKPETHMFKELEALLLPPPPPKIAFLATPLFLLNLGRWRVEAAICSIAK